jgi:hypothetical protein
VQVIPSIDIDHGRSRVVFWPGASSGVGAPTDRPDRIAERFVELGARVVHVVDFDGARTGSPGNLEAVGAMASRIAVPIQLAGGLEGPDQATGWPSGWIRDPSGSLHFRGEDLRCRRSRPSSRSWPPAASGASSSPTEGRSRTPQCCPA